MLPTAPILSLVDRVEKAFATTPTHVVEYLESSERELIQVMADNDCWPGPLPAPTGPRGNAAFGIVPYYLHNPPAEMRAAIDGLAAPLRSVANAALAFLRQAIPTRIDPQTYEKLVARIQLEGGFVSADGVIHGLRKYENLDPSWLWKFFNERYTRAVGPYDYVPAPPPPVPLGTNGGRVTLALVGDWGTGPYPVGSDSDGPALEVMRQIVTLKPDYLIHLGDVYYAGTPNHDDLKDLLYLPGSEERDNFLNYWPAVGSLAAGNSFALNSNHEMYGGGQGYFRTVLADSRFSRQNPGGRSPSSCFALTCAGWTVVGLDSAYYDPSPMYDIGSLGGALSTWQAAWVKSLGLDPTRLIVLTHHNPIGYDGSQVETYTDDAGNVYGPWPEVTAALGGVPPAAWYYGHAHCGVVYQPRQNNPESVTLLRCLGNGGIPYGDARGLKDNPGGAIAYYYHTPNPSDPYGLMVANGFALLTITDDGTVQEDFYEQGPVGGPPRRVFGSRYSFGGQPRD